MSSTLPRTRSVGSATALATFSNGTNNKSRVRPVSLCETSWAKMAGQDLRQHNLQRTPSQARNLCTTVPTNLVAQNLGGRHTPTRNSLRHSRMIVQSKTGYGIRDRRWLTAGIGRAGIALVTAQMVVGVVGVTLAAWFWLWSPSLRFREMPHYAALPVLATGVSGALLIGLLVRRRNRRVLTNAVKVVTVVLATLSILACLCLCVFTAIHLIHLSPMKCRIRHDVIIHRPSSNINNVVKSAPKFDNSIPRAKRSSDLQVANRAVLTTSKRSIGDVEEFTLYDDQGSGKKSYDDNADVDYEEYRDLEVETATVQNVASLINEQIMVNITSCTCESHYETFTHRLDYPELSCPEVRNLLPILFIASCVIAATGAMLSSVIIYFVWASRHKIYGGARPYETRPFIFSKTFNSDSVKSQITNGRRGEAVSNRHS
ncbi:uncharacterized protein LOC143034633 isoform X2 [Oratosquilla oratoria]|uniref:uncharacterized protein LOC143034633 isoform X2 n=1 Tax=Oratosquilla oratoria TaxID=337810 RepID=UPI003F762881